MDETWHVFTPCAFVIFKEIFPMMEIFEGTFPMAMTTAIIISKYNIVSLPFLQANRSSDNPV